MPPSSVMRAPAAAAALAAALLATARAKTVPASSTTLDTRACQAPHDTLGFCNVSATLAERSAALIALLHDDEITPQITARHGGGGSPGPASNISRIGLPEYECVRGRSAPTRPPPSRISRRTPWAHVPRTRLVRRCVGRRTP